MKTKNILVPLTAIAFLVWTAGCDKKNEATTQVRARPVEPVKETAPVAVTPEKPKEVVPPVNATAQALLDSAKSLTGEGKAQDALAKLKALGGENLSSEQKALADTLQIQVDKLLAADAKAATDAAAKVAAAKAAADAAAVAAKSVKAGNPLKPGEPLKVGDALPDLATFGLEGQMPDELKGKVILLDFWASWCGPCKESFPVMEELHQKYGSKGLVILAVNVDEKAASMKDFLKEHPVQFTILHDATKKLVGAAKIGSMPTSFVIGKDGVVVSLHKGFHGKESSTQYVAEVEKLLASNVASK